MSRADPAGEIPAPVRALATGLVDYAGLFPPANLGMAEAMANYAAYLAGPDAWMLGRFVLPNARLAEFDALSAGLLSSGEGSAPWRIAALSGDELAADVEAALGFNCRHWPGSEIGHAIIDSIELRVSGYDPDVRKHVPDFFTLYVESATGARGSLGMLDALQASGARAKIRVGGVTPDAFPSPEDVVAFVSGCVGRGLPFKATAGLHHLIRSDYPLTYEAGSSRATMYGYLNVFLAAAALASGASTGDARGILLESDMTSIQFGGGEVHWRDLTLSTADIRRARGLATSFGSCSFREPVDELAGAGLLR
ncbi:MAG TPA: hypothetical protein VMY38_07935 [Gemmatimonadaceae bacterium]|nr:hypothetical protein [Gemmatimonadaceae bacterium]